MFDQRSFLRQLAGFAVVLPARYDHEAVLSELTESATLVLGLSGSGVTMARDGRLRFLTAVSAASEELARDYAQHHPCPCREACATDEVVRVTDVRAESTRWPEFSATATRLRLAGVATIPLRLADRSIGSLNLYSSEPRAWSDEDIGLAELLADVAISHVVNASRLRPQGQLAEQMQDGLESRMVIEVAKGVTSETQGITLDQAFQRMRRHARRNHTSLRRVSEAIVTLGLRV